MGCVFVRIKSLDDDGENTKTVVTEKTQNCLDILKSGM